MLSTEERGLQNYGFLSAWGNGNGVRRNPSHERLQRGANRSVVLGGSWVRGGSDVNLTLFVVRLEGSMKAE